MKKIDNIDLLSTRSGLQKKLNENFEEIVSNYYDKKNIDLKLPLEGEVGSVLTKGTPTNKWELLKDSATPADLENTIKHLIKHLAPNGKIVLKNRDTLQYLPFKTVPTDVYDFSQMTTAPDLFREMPYLESLNDFDFSKITTAKEVVKNSPEITEFINHTTGNIRAFFWTFASSSFKHADFNTSGAMTTGHMLGNSLSLESLALLDATNWTEAASFLTGCIKLKDVAGFKNLSCDAGFWACYAITPESMQNIATQAKDMTGLEPISFSFMKVVVNRTPEAILQMFTDKNIIIKAM